jgi:pRiA4b ORF-3-like protein
VTGPETNPADELLRRFLEAVSGSELDDLRELAGRLLTRDPDLTPQAPRPVRRRPPRERPATYRIRVDLEDASPPIWRRLDVRCDLRLDSLHQVLQAAFGWSDSHLHRFALGESVFDRDAELFLCPYDVEEGDDHGVPDRSVRLDETLVEPGDVLRYCYDYGDSWDLVITLESVRPLEASAPLAICVAGGRAGPPEDCGGLRDGTDLEEVLEDPARFDLEEVNQALVDPFVLLRESGVHEELVDLVTRLRGSRAGEALVIRLLTLLNDRPVRTGDEERAAVLAPMLWFLDRVGEDGLTLTSAGYLRPVDVSAAAHVVPGGARWVGRANREAHTYPVLRFRESLQGMGLVRRHRGRLQLTRAGQRARGNPTQLWGHLAGRLPLGRPGSVENHAGWVALLLAATSADGVVSAPEVAEALTELGWRDGRKRQDVVDEYSARWAASTTLDVLESLVHRSRRAPASRPLSPEAADLAADTILGPTR